MKIYFLTQNEIFKPIWPMNCFIVIISLEDDLPLQRRFATAIVKSNLTSMTKKTVPSFWLSLYYY